MFNQWELMAPMPQAVLHPAVAATNQRIYMFGGEDAMQNPVRLIQVNLLTMVVLSIIFPFHPNDRRVRVNPKVVLNASNSVK